MKEGTMMLPAESPAADPGEELMGKEDEPVFDGMPPIAVIFDAESWLVGFCTVASRRVLERKLEKDPERSVRRMGTWLPELKKPRNLQLKKKNPQRKSPMNPTWRRHCC